MTAYLIAAPDADVGDTVLPVLRDSGGRFAAAYQPEEGAVCVVRPDGYLGYAASGVDIARLRAHLRSTFS
jgi:hypothetical protein